MIKFNDKTNLKNYRPIALLCNFAEITADTLTTVLYYHVKSFIIPEQHGFVKSRSTTTNLLEFTQHVSKASDNKSQVNAIYIQIQVRHFIE